MMNFRENIQNDLNSVDWQPSVPCNVIASGAVAVPAGIISFCHVPTGIKDFPVGAEFTAPAVFNVIHDLVLSGMQSVFRSESVSVFPEDIFNAGT